MKNGGRNISILHFYFTRKFTRKPTDFGRRMNRENKMFNYLKINGKFLKKITNFCVLLDNNYQVKQFKI